MRKKDFWILMACNLGTLILLIEHLCGLELALLTMCIWTAISMVIHICILKDYIITHEYVKEDNTK